jgi:hypothetical protein
MTNWRTVGKKLYREFGNKLLHNTSTLKDDKKMLYDAAIKLNCSDEEAQLAIGKFYSLLSMFGPYKKPMGESKMKLFSEFLAENIRKYEYNVKLSFKPDNEMMAAIENVLQKYNLSSITQPKSLPIARIDKDFPGMIAPEIYVFKVEVDYPASTDMIRHTIASVGFAFETVAVSSASLTWGINKDHDTADAEQEASIAKNTGDKPLLDSPYDPQNNEEISGENFGDTYNSRLVKNSIGSTDQIIPREFKKIKGAQLTDAEYKIGKESAVGSTVNKLPPIKSFAR